MTKTGQVALAVLGLTAVPLAVVLLRVGDAPPPAAPSSAASSSSSQAVVARDLPALEAAARLAQRDPVGSREALRRALRERPNDPELLGALGRKLVIDESVEARGLATRCLEIDPEATVCAEVLKRAIDPLPRDDRTSKFLDGCLESDAARAPCLASLVVERLRRGDVDGAQQAAGRLARAAPDSPLTPLMEGRAFSASGRYREALSRFEEACRAREDYACYRVEALRRDGW